MGVWYKRIIVGGLLLGAVFFGIAVWRDGTAYWVFVIFWPVAIYVALAVISVIDYGNHLKAGGSFEDDFHKVDGSSLRDDDPELQPYFLALRLGTGFMSGGRGGGGFSGGGGSFGGGGASGGW